MGRCFGIMRLLIVEDEPHLRYRLAQTFRKRGYSVDEAGDGRQALEKGEDWSYDAIVLDVMLPELNGWQVLRSLRDRGDRTPVLMLTALSDVDDRVKGLDLGADDYLVKPFSLKELFARVAAMIRRSGGEPSPVIKIDDVIIDKAAHSITRSGTPVEFTAREFSVLEILLAKRGQVVSRSYIYDHICDEFDSPASNVVEVHVCNVRKKLGGDFIRTVRGRGYLISN